jgi:hypothetical protein
MIGHTWQWSRDGTRHGHDPLGDGSGGTNLPQGNMQTRHNGRAPNCAHGSLPPRLLKAGSIWVHLDPAGAIGIGINRAEH